MTHFPWGSESKKWENQPERCWVLPQWSVWQRCELSRPHWPRWHPGANQWSELSPGPWVRKAGSHQDSAAPWTPESVTSNVPPVWGLMKSVSHSLFRRCRLINNVCLHNKTLSSQDCAFSYVHLTLLSIFSRAIRQILPVWVPKHIISWEDNGSPAFSTLCRQLWLQT